MSSASSAAATGAGLLSMLGSADATVCEDGVCAVPERAEAPLSGQAPPR